VFLFFLSFILFVVNKVILGRKCFIAIYLSNLFYPNKLFVFGNLLTNTSLLVIGVNFYVFYYCTGLSYLLVVASTKLVVFRDACNFFCLFYPFF
jgi:hypothetical protein